MSSTKSLAYPACGSRRYCLSRIDRHFGEVVQDEVIDRTRTHLKERRLGPVTPEGLSTGDTDHEITPSLSLTHFLSR